MRLFSQYRLRLHLAKMSEWNVEKYEATEYPEFAVKRSSQWLSVPCPGYDFVEGWIYSQRSNNHLWFVAGKKTR